MLIGQLVVIGIGISEVGGTSEVWELNKEWDRLKAIFNLMFLFLH